MAHSTVWTQVYDEDDQAWDVNVECTIFDREVVDWKVTYVETGCPLAQSEIDNIVESNIDTIEASALESYHG